MNNGEQEFRDAFPTLARLIDATGEHVVQVTHSISGDDVIVICKRRSNGRGWGMVLRDGVLTGMRHHRFDSAVSDAAPDNVAFVSEFKRRLAVIGASLLSIEGGAGYMMACDDLAARSGSRKKRRPPTPYPAVKAQLRACAF